MFVPYTIVNPLTIVRIPRRLSHHGKVLARVGAAVEPSHIVAQAIAPADFRIIDVVRELDVPIKKAKSCMQVKRGAKVSVGDILATRGGLGGRAIRAPINGVVVGQGRGRLLLEAKPRVLRVTAFIPGTVVATLPNEGAIIETIGAHIQAVWGNGREAYGTLRVVVRAPRHPIRPKHIDTSSQGAILVGGARIDADTLEQAVEMQVGGIILGGISAALLPRLKELPFPVITTEGIGEMPMSQAIFDLLRSLKGREASLSAVLQQRGRMDRPYLVVPMPTQVGNPIDPDTPLTIGSRVRVLRGPYMGRSGTVTEMPASRVSLESGARFLGVYVDVGKDNVFVPYVNIERLL